MIVVSREEVAISGYPNEILAELTFAIRSVNNTLTEDIDPKITKELIEKAMRYAFMPKDEIMRDLRR